jgi:GDPmannose 4,6-dehydratase
MTKTALITGVNGQDGSYLADLLLSKGYKVYGMERRCSTKNRINTSHLEGKITFINGDLADQNSLFRCLRECDPDEVYNLGAMSFVGESWNTPETTGNINGIGVLRILEAIREYNKSIKFYQASTSEMFGKVTETPQRETTPFYPRSPYGVSKLYGYWITKNYRESYNMFACNGILFNHESERRGKEFVTRKISDGVAKISLGLSTHIHLGNLDAKRDWGYAPDYVDAMWRMLQQDIPRDFVISTGETYSIKDFLEKSFRVIGITDWEKYVKYDERFMRPSEVDYLIGDFSKAKKFLNWEPTVSFEEMIDKMVNNDIKLLSTSV